MLCLAALADGFGLVGDAVVAVFGVPQVAADVYAEGLLADGLAGFVEVVGVGGEFFDGGGEVGLGVWVVHGVGFLRPLGLPMGVMPCCLA